MDDVQLADVHAQLQGVGADHAQQLAVAQAALDGPPLRGQVAAAVAADAARAGPSPSRSASRSVESISSTPTRERPKTRVWRPARRNGRAQRVASVSGRAARAGGRIQQRRLDHQDVALAGRGAVAVHEPRLRGR